MSASIYVQIPAYRDRELLSTVSDLLATAAAPERLTVAIAWQYGPDEAHVEPVLRSFDAVRLIAIPAADSLGCNWARRMLQEGWDGEAYTLILDSHHRFVRGWDARLVDMYGGLQQRVAKPILTGYLPPYVPNGDPAHRVEAVYRMAIEERRAGLAYRLTGHAISGWRRLTTPVAASFASLHMLFTAGSFNEVVRFDPEIYFFADEVAVALRAFTHGYDLFHPHQVLGWHLYDRSTRVTHWDDHADWSERNDTSLRRLRELYEGSDTGTYGLGTERSVADYEAATGVQLIREAVSTYREEHRP